MIFKILKNRRLIMRKFTIDMTMSYDFQVTIEAESEEAAKANEGK